MMMTKEEIYIYLYNTFPLYYKQRSEDNGVDYIEVDNKLKPYKSYDYGFRIYANDPYYEGHFHSLADGLHTVRCLWKHLVKKFELDEVYSVRICREYLKDYRECGVVFKRIIKINSLL